MNKVLILFFFSSFLLLSSDSIDTDMFIQEIAHHKKVKKQIIYDWEIPGKGNAIKWDEAQDSYGKDGFERGGEVIFNNNGKITHHSIGGEAVKNGKWFIKLYGNKDEMTKVKVSPDHATQENPKFEIKKIYTQKKLLCENSSKEITNLYLLKYPEKKSLWVKERTIPSQKGEGEASTYIFTFEKKQPCRIADLEEEEKNHIVRTCVKTDKNNINAKIGSCERAIELDPKNRDVNYLLASAYKKSKNYKSAMKYYKKASKLGLKKADYAIGMMYYKGLGVEKNIKKTFIYAKKAGDGGYSTAYIALGGLYLKGIGTEVNFETSEKYYRKAISMGDKRGEEKLKKLKKLKEQAEKEAQEKVLKSESNATKDAL